MEGTRRDSEGHEYGPADRFREYEVVVLNDSTSIYRGFGMTLARVVADESEHQRSRHEMNAKAGRETAAEFAAGEPDRVVWEGLRVLCVLRPTVGGSLDVLFPCHLPDDAEGGAL